MYENYIASLHLYKFVLQLYHFIKFDTEQK